MGWIEGMNAAVDCIEDSLREGPDVAEAARRAACTEGQFRRMFACVAGVGLDTYVRRRKMTCAALDLAAGARVLDTALRWGYASPTAFARAFRETLGLLPSEARRPGVRLPAFPKLAFSLAVCGAEPIGYRIVPADALRLVGLPPTTLPPIGSPAVAGPFAQAMPQGRALVGQCWSAAARAGAVARLGALADGSGPAGVLGVTVADCNGAGGYRIAAATEAPAFCGADEVRVPAATWAVFDCVGPCNKASAGLYQRIFAEWLPVSGYEMAAPLSLEAYPAGEFSSDAYRSEVWMPVVRSHGA